MSLCIFFATLMQFMIQDYKSRGKNIAVNITAVSLTKCIDKVSGVSYKGLMNLGRQKFANVKKIDPKKDKNWNNNIAKLLSRLYFSGQGSADPSPVSVSVSDKRVTIRSRAPATKGRAKRGAKEAAKFRFQMRLVAGAGRRQRKTAMKNVFCPAQVKTSQVSAYLVPFLQQLSFFPHICICMPRSEIEKNCLVFIHVFFRSAKKVCWKNLWRIARMMRRRMTSATSTTPWRGSAGSTSSAPSTASRSASPSWRSPTRLPSWWFLRRQRTFVKFWRGKR